MSQFPATNESLAESWKQAKTTARRLRSYAGQRSAEMTAGAVSANVLIDIFAKLVTFETEFARIKDVPGIVAYARQIENDGNLDVAAAFQSMRSAVTIAGQWIDQNIDKNNGWLLTRKLTATGVSVRSYNSAFTAPLVAELNAIVNVII